MQKLIKAALEAGWDADDRATLADLILTLGSQKIEFGSKARDIKRAVAQLRGET
jgi:hypothetical protein